MGYLVLVHLMGSYNSATLAFSNAFKFQQQSQRCDDRRGVTATVDEPQISISIPISTT
jgi:hypothetical protein